MNKGVTKQFTKSIEKISNMGDEYLKNENILDWEIDKIILTSKSNPDQKIECYWVMQDGEFKKVCKRIN